MPESYDLNTREKMLPRSSNNSTKISFSEDDEDMNVDFDMDVDTDDDDVRNEENDGDCDPDGPTAAPLIPEKKAESPPSKHTTDAEEAVDMDTENHGKKVDPKKREQTNRMASDGRSSSDPNTGKIW